MSDNIESIRENADERYELDVEGIIYNAVYSAITSVSGGAALEYAGAINPNMLPVAVILVFVTQVIPKIFKELSRRHAMNEARREGYIDGVLENHDGGDSNGGSGKRKGIATFIFSMMGSIGKSSAF